MKFGGKKYDTQFINTEIKEKELMHDIHQIAVDAILRHTTEKKRINRNVEREIFSMYNEQTQIKDMKLMIALCPDSITKKKKG